jgi:tetratricopeptide (TPR) repeat protein
MRLITVFLFICCLSNTVLCQITTDEQLAEQYYQNKEYEKALVYYEKLYNKNPSPQYYSYYLSCLLETKDFKKAEKVVKKVIRQLPSKLNYVVDLGVIYKASGNPEKAEQQFQQAIKNISPDQEQVLTLADAFIDIREFDHAVSAYKKGRNLLGEAYPFSFELAEVYKLKGDDTGMINEYLDLLQENVSYMGNIQNALQTAFTSESDPKKNELIKTELLKRIQKNPDNTIFSELLIWMLVQQKDFESAFIQAKAIDRRKKEDGSRLMTLAKLSSSNENYDVAAKCYEYVITKGDQNYNYVQARIELLNTLYKKVVDQHQYDSAGLTALELNFTSTLEELGKYSETVQLIKKLAHLKAFYMNKTSEAITLLNEAIALPKLSPQLQAECKLELGDILLMSGEIWEASLTYSQVEKAYWHDVLGQEAKFRNAKIAFYTGDFKWAQAQLDVLKAATAKLIANDAMDLSLLISDNLAIDTNPAPLLLFAKADLLAFQNRDMESMTKLDSINTLFPNHSLADDILFKKYKIYLRQGNANQAAEMLNKIINDFPNSILADDALFNLAELNETKLNNKTKAMELYQELLVKFPGSLFTVDARKRFRALRGDVLN